MGREEVLKHGNWSGPGWTAKVSAEEFKKRGVARKLSKEEFKTPGVDRYDNFVAKAHDLNEYIALDPLRARLSKLGLADNDVTKIGVHDAYEKALREGKGDDELERFVSLNHYADMLSGKNPADGQMQELVKAFINYYTHAMYSNLQFTVDVTLNGVSGISLTMLQSWGSPIFFNREARKLEDQCKRAELKFGVEHLGTTELSGYLGEHFLSPTDRKVFEPVNGENYIPALTRKAILSSDRQDLVEASSGLIFKKNDVSRSTLARKFQLERPNGCDSVDELLSFLHQ